MNIKKLVLTALTVLIVGSQAQGSALKASLETAKKSLSTLAQTKLGKAVLDNKGKVGLAAGAYSYYAYRLHKYFHPNGINTVEQAKFACINFFLHIINFGALLHYGTEGSLKSSLEENVIPLMLIFANWLSIYAQTNDGFMNAIAADDGTAFASYLKGFALIRPDKAIRAAYFVTTQNPAIAQQLFNDAEIKSREEHVAFFQDRPGMVQYFADHGIANSAEGHAALLHVRPDIAQQIFAPKHNELTRALETAIPEFTNGIANEIASFNTGITVKKPMPESAKKLEAETAGPEVLTDELQKILHDAFAEWES